MNIYDSTFYIFGISVHTITVLILFTTFFFCILKTKQNGIKSLIFSSFALLFCVHFYEFLHGCFGLIYTGHTSETTFTFNLPFALFGLIMLIIFHKINFGLPQLFFFTLALMSMFTLGEVGFFLNFTKSIWWVISKISLSLLSYSLLKGDKKRSNPHV